jgi:hypothetical protein
MFAGQTQLCKIHSWVFWVGPFLNGVLVRIFANIAPHRLSIMRHIYYVDGRIACKQTALFTCLRTTRTFYNNTSFSKQIVLCLTSGANQQECDRRGLWHVLWPTGNSFPFSSQVIVLLCEQFVLDLSATTTAVLSLVHTSRCDTVCRCRSKTIYHGLLKNSRNLTKKILTVTHSFHSLLQSSPFGCLNSPNFWGLLRRRL